MAAGTLIKIKRKAGAPTTGQLAAGELLLDVSNNALYSSSDGSAVFLVGPGAGAGDALTSASLAQFAATTSAELRGVISDETGTGLLVFADTPTLVTPVLGVASATTVNKITITAPATGATLTISDGGSLITSGGHSVTFTSTGATTVTLPTSGTLATQAYVDAAVAGLLDYKGGYDASSNTPDLDVSPSGILKGDSYTVTAAGNFFSEAVAVGDFLIAEQDNPTLASHWTIVEKNQDGVAVTGNPLSQFAATSSSQLAGVMSDETGTGALVFANTPTLVTPKIQDTSADHQYVFAVSELAADRTITLPLLTANDTFVFAAFTQTLTNKTIGDSGSTIDGGTI